MLNMALHLKHIYKIQFQRLTWTIGTIYIRDFEGLRIDEQLLNETGYTTKHFHENLES